jgi:acetyl-CoA synthetase
MIPGSCTLPLPGIQAAIVDEAGADVPNGQGGILVVKRPWPSMIRNIWGDPDRFVKSYFPEELGGTLYLRVTVQSEIKIPATSLLLVVSMMS